MEVSKVELGLGQSSGNDEQETRDKDFLTLWQRTQQWHRQIADTLIRLTEKNVKAAGNPGGGQYGLPETFEIANP